MIELIQELPGVATSCSHTLLRTQAADSFSTLGRSSGLPIPPGLKSASSSRKLAPYVHHVTWGVARGSQESPLYNLACNLVLQLGDPQVRRVGVPCRSGTTNTLFCIQALDCLFYLYS